MRTNEERLAAMHKRAAEIEREDRNRKVMIMETAGIAIGFAAVLILAILMPGMAGNFVHTDVTNTMRASIFSENNAIGYIVIGIIAFLFGISVAVFCFRLKKWRDAEENKEKASRQ